MSQSDQEHNEYFDLPDDPEVAFAVLQQRKFSALERIWADSNSSSWYDERRYVDTLIAFDEVHDLGILTAFKSPPNSDRDFGVYFQDFRRTAEIASQKILMEAARPVKSGSNEVVVLDGKARAAIHQLISAIREKLNDLALPEKKRDALFNKLNEFAAEVDRNRTRPEAFFSFAVDFARATREVNDEIKPLQKTIDRVFDWIEKAQKWKDSLPTWEERRRIEGPRKKLPPPNELDDDIPF